MDGGDAGSVRFRSRADVERHGGGKIFILIDLWGLKSFFTLGMIRVDGEEINLLEEEAVWIVDIYLFWAPFDGWY